MMKFAYVDPPYLGCGKLYPEHPEAKTWDDLQTHQRLIDRLMWEFPDGWAMSLSTPSLQVILPLCPTDVRIAAWVKPFAAFKANVRVAYTWEPVIVYGGRLSSKNGATPNRDHLTTTEPEALREGITMKKGLTGAKPERFCSWVLDLLGWKPGDEVIDLFPGTGVMSKVVQQRECQRELL